MAGGTRCVSCNVGTPQIEIVGTQKHGMCWEPYRVKRIPPLPELDEVKKDEEITA